MKFSFRIYEQKELQNITHKDLGELSFRHNPGATLGSGGWSRGRLLPCQGAGKSP